MFAWCRPGFVVYEQIWICNTKQYTHIYSFVFLQTIRKQYAEAEYIGALENMLRFVNGTAAYHL